MQAVQALPASSGSSLRPVSTSNRAGSRAAGSRGPWSSAELATRPVRKGPPKPKENAPDSRKTRTSNHRIPGAAKGVTWLDTLTREEIPKALQAYTTPPFLVSLQGNDVWIIAHRVACLDF